MYRSLLSVGGFTLLSRVTGFLRDIVLGAVLGDGLLSDAFFVAFRLPNHFRTIFGEVAFNSAYVPCYSQVLETEGPESAHAFSSQIFTILLASQVVLLALAWLFTPQLIDLLAHGYRADPRKFDAAVSMTRITFPYLLFIVIVTLQSGTLNANGRFAAAGFRAGAPQPHDRSFFSALAFPLPQCRHRGELRHHRLRPAATFAHRPMRRRADRHSRTLSPVPPWTPAVSAASSVRLGPAVIGSAGAQIADVRRHDHRVLCCRRAGSDVDLLCRPHVPAAARRDRELPPGRCCCRR